MSASNTPSVPVDPGRGEMTLACGCAGRCTVLHIQRFQPFKDEQEEWYFDFFTRAGERSPLWWRIKLAVKMLLGRDHFCHALIWSDREIEELRRFLNHYVPVVYAPNSNHTAEMPRNTNG